MRGVLGFAPCLRCLPQDGGVWVRRLRPRAMRAGRPRLRAMRAGRPRTQAGGQDARAPRRAGKTPAHPGVWAEEMPAPQACVQGRCLRIRDGAALRAGETSAHPAYKGRFLASPCVRSPISVVRTPKLPLLPVWEKGVGGMRGKGARECRTLLISPKNSTLASRGVRGKSAPECRKSRISFKKSTLESAYPGAVRAGRPRPQTSVRAGRLRPQATSCSIVI